MNEGAKILALATPSNANAYCSRTSTYTRWGYCIELLGTIGLAGRDDEVEILASAFESMLYG